VENGNGNSSLVLFGHNLSRFVAGAEPFADTFSVMQIDRV